MIGRISKQLRFYIDYAFFLKWHIENPESAALAIALGVGVQTYKHIDETNLKTLSKRKKVFLYDTF